MKKIFIFILALLYIAGSTGATVNMHYCMDKLAAWDFGHDKSNTCDKCGMKKGQGCCRDEHKFIKNSADQKTAEAGIQMAELLAIALPVSFIEIVPVHLISITLDNSISQAPLRSCGVAVYIRNCVFLI